MADLTKQEYTEKLLEALVDRYEENYELTEDELRWETFEALEFAAEMFTEVLYDTEAIYNLAEAYAEAALDVDGNEDDDPEDDDSEDEDEEEDEYADYSEEEIQALLIQALEAYDAADKVEPEVCYCKDCSKARLHNTAEDGSLADRLAFYKAYQ